MDVSRYVAIVAFLLVLALIPAVNATAFDNWNVDIAINSDGSADWTITLMYKEATDRVDYWVLGEVTNVRGTLDGIPIRCVVTKPEVGSSITCPTNIQENQTAELTFTTQSATGKLGAYQIFKYNFALTDLTEKFSLKVSLPKGASLLAAETLIGTGLAPFEPAYGREGTDGQRIYVTWELQNPRLGEGIPVSVIFEQFFMGEIPGWVIVLIIAIILIAVTTTWILYKRRKGPESILEVLTDPERKVMELLLAKGSLDQRDVVKHTGFSKAKVSRIVHSLVTRGLIQAVLKGRTREIRMIPRQSRAVLGNLRAKLALSNLSREQAIELVKYLLSPWKTSLEKEYRDLDRAVRTKSFGVEKWKPLTVQSDVQPILNDALQLSPKLEALVSNHNTVIKQLNDEIKSLSKIIWKRVGTRYHGLAGRQPPSGTHNSLAENVLHDTPLDDRSVAEWHFCGTELIKIRNERAVSERIQTTVRIAKELAATNAAVRNELEQLYEQTRKYHKLPLRIK